MRFVHPFINERFDLDNGQVHTLVIENPRFFFKLLTDVQVQIDGCDGKAVLSENNSPIPFNRYAELLDTFVPFDINKKTLLTKICIALEKRAVSPELYEKSMKIMTEVENYLHEVAFDLPCDVQFDKLSISSLIKAASPELRDEYTSLAEKVLDYMELVNEFNRKKVFFIVNMRSYIDDEETERFAQTVSSHGYQILMIENVDRKTLRNEKKIIIDNDLCEIG